MSKAQPQKKGKEFFSTLKARFKPGSSTLQDRTSSPTVPSQSPVLSFPLNHSQMHNPLAGEQESSSNQDAGTFSPVTAAQGRFHSQEPSNPYRTCRIVAALTTPIAPDISKSEDASRKSSSGFLGVNRFVRSRSRSRDRQSATTSETLALV